MGDMFRLAYSMSSKKGTTLIQTLNIPEQTGLNVMTAQGLVYVNSVRFSYCSNPYKNRYTCINIVKTYL